MLSGSKAIALPTWFSTYHKMYVGGLGDDENAGLFHVPRYALTI